MLEEVAQNHRHLKAQKKKFREDDDDAEFFIESIIEYMIFQRESIEILEGLGIPDWLIEARSELQDEEEGGNDEDPVMQCILFEDYAILW